MKKILLVLMGFTGLVSPALVFGQPTGPSFTPTADTVWATVGGVASVHNDLTNTTTGSLNLSWHVKATSFPADWAAPAALGICDASMCRGNTADTLLWNVALSAPGQTFSCPYPASTTSNLNLQLDLTAATTLGMHWLTVAVTDPATLYTKNVTWVINHVPVGVPSVANNANEMLIYPNPAHDEVNVVYDANADVKNIAIYNIIGKVMAIYKVNGPSANLNLENVPSGIYFVRLINSKGSVVLTKKFTKQ